MEYVSVGFGGLNKKINKLLNDFVVQMKENDILGYFHHLYDYPRN